MRLSLLLTASAIVRATWAVFADEAWDVDFHYPLLGQPIESTTFFHQPNSASRASLIYTLSDEGVIGAVNPRDGSLVWRQHLSAAFPGFNATFLRAGQGQDVVVSALGSQVAAWSAADGRQVWSHSTAGELQDLEILELSDGKERPGQKDAVVISGGDHPAVQRLEGSTGGVKWQYNIAAGDIPYQVSASDTQVFAILLHKTMLGYLKIKVVSLDPVTGSKTDEHTLSTESELASVDTIVAVGANSASPIIAWTDAARTVLKVNIIGTKSVSSFKISPLDGQDVTDVRLHAPFATNSQPHFLVHYTSASSHSAEVFHINLSKNTVQSAYNLPVTPGKAAFSTSVSDANVYFTQVIETGVKTFSSSSKRELGSWNVASFGIVAPDATPVHAVAEVSVKGDSVSAVRAAVLLSSGDWVLLRDGKALWNRPEALASTSIAVLASPHALGSLLGELEHEAASNPAAAYVHRIRRHIQDWQRFPAFAQSLPKRIAGSLFGTSAERHANKDPFGFHQVVVCATRSGRAVAIDTGSPDRILMNVKLDELRTRQADGAVKGLDLDDLMLSTLLTGHFPTDHHSHDTSPSEHQIEYTVKDGRLEASSPSYGVVWHFTPAEGERVISLTPRPSSDPVASIGKVLGDRSVLYKYLNPNLALLTAVSDVKRTASFYIIDTVSGAVIYSTSHTDVDLDAPISSILSENWFAYSFTAEASGDSPKGHQLVSGEMYESLIPNDRGPLMTQTNSSSMLGGSDPATLTLTFQISEPISGMSVTQTKQGITSRQILAVLRDTNSIVGIPLAVIDPRRPAGRDPTKNELAEGLAKYEPVLEFSPKWYLNHQREVLGVQRVITSPAYLESTSLVFAYGLDVFGTRISPSFNFDVLGKDFNKIQMLSTVAALFVATVVVAPLVQRKQVNARWLFA